MNADNALPHRMAFLGLGLLGAIGVIAILSALLKTGSGAALLLLDKGTTPLFPYPFTLQNVMWIALGLGLGDVARRIAASAGERRLLEARLLPEQETDLIRVSDLGAIRRRLDEVARVQPGFLVSLLDACILSISTTQGTEQSQSVLSAKLDLELHRVELRYSLLRYLVWVVPTLGFIGTVVGLAQALRYLSPDSGYESAAAAMGPIIENLALAFNTTILALVFSAVLVMFMQLAQRREEEAINAGSEYCLQNLLNRFARDVSPARGR